MKHQVYPSVYIFILFYFFERHKWKKSLQRWTLTLEGHIGGSVSGHGVLLVTSWSDQKFWQSFFLSSDNLFGFRQTFCYFITAFTTHHMSYKYVCFLVQGHGYWTHPCVCSFAHQARHYHEEWALGGSIIKNGLIAYGTESMVIVELGL
jgi:hypothetical protein